MSGKMIEGQMDFFGLLTEYTDSQGATVRVHDPGKKAKPEPVTEDFFEGPLESVEDLREAERQRKLDKERERAENIARIEAEFKKAEEAKELKKKEEAEKKIKAIEDEKLKKAAEEFKKIEEAKKTEEIKKAEAEKRRKAEEELRIRKEQEEKKQKEIEEKKKQEETRKKEARKEEARKEEVKQNVSDSKEQLFKQCKRCWCFSCKHNSRNEGVPREMCGTKMACPACKGCIDEDMATICEIGNAKEGCMTRAIEEGIVVPEEM